MFELRIVDDASALQGLLGSMAVNDNYGEIEQPNHTDGLGKLDSDIRINVVFDGERHEAHLVGRDGTNQIFLAIATDGVLGYNAVVFSCRPTNDLQLVDPLQVMLAGTGSIKKAVDGLRITA